MTETSLPGGTGWSGVERRRTPQPAAWTELAPGGPLDRVNRVTQRLSAAMTAHAALAEAPADPKGKHQGLPAYLLDDGTAAKATSAALGSETRTSSHGVIDSLEDLATWAVTELEYRRALDATALSETLSDRLLGPVQRLGDAVRTTASLAATPHDPRLGRVASMAKSRMETVEAVTEDLRDALETIKREAPLRICRFDAGQRLAHAARVVGGGASEVDLDLGSVPAPVEGNPHAFDSFLILVLTTATNHATHSPAVAARVSVDDTEVRIEVTSPGHKMPLGDVLRVVARYPSPPSQGTADANVASKGDVVVVSSGAVQVTTGPEGTTFLITQPKVADA